MPEVQRSASDGAYRARWLLANGEIFKLLQRLAKYSEPVSFAAYL